VIGGKVTEFTVGWVSEPAFADQLNKVDLRVVIVSENKSQPSIPAVGLENSLKVEVSTGGKSITLDLKLAFREPGHYTPEIMPTVAGTYVFRFFGTVNGTTVNEVFDCSKGGFNCVRSASEVQFPEKPPSSREIQNTLSNIDTKLSDIDSRISSIAAGSNQSQSTLGNLSIISYGGLVAGVVGILIAVLAFKKRGK